MLAPLAKGAPFPVEEEYDPEPGLPSGFSRPELGVPASNPLRCFALALYGPHASGADLDANERAMLKRIAQNAAAVYGELETTICGTRSRPWSASCQETRRPPKSVQGRSR